MWPSFTQSLCFYCYVYSVRHEAGLSSARQEDVCNHVCNVSFHSRTCSCCSWFTGRRSALSCRASWRRGCCLQSTASPKVRSCHRWHPKPRLFQSLCFTSCSSSSFAFKSRGTSAALQRRQGTLHSTERTVWSRQPSRFPSNVRSLSDEYSFQQEATTANMFRLKSFALAKEKLKHYWQTGVKRFLIFHAVLWFGIIFTTELWTRNMAMSCMQVSGFFLCTLLN